MEAFEIRFQIRRGLERKAINPPCAVAGAFDHSLLTQIGEMLGDLGLRKAENFLEMTNTKGTPCQQMDDPQPRDVAEAAVNRDQFHQKSMRLYIYLSICIFVAVVPKQGASACGERDAIQVPTFDEKLQRLG